MRIVNNILPIVTCVEVMCVLVQRSECMVNLRPWSCVMWEGSGALPERAPYQKGPGPVTGSCGASCESTRPLAAPAADRGHVAARRGRRHRHRLATAFLMPPLATANHTPRFTAFFTLYTIQNIILINTLTSNNQFQLLTVHELIFFNNYITTKLP